MSEHWRLRPTEQARQHDLPTGGIEQILASNHQGDSLERVVGSGSPLVGPVSKTITDQKIAALPRRRLLLSPDKRVIEPLIMRLYPHAPTDVVCQRQIAIATSAVVHRAVDLLARTIAGVNEPSSHEGHHGLAIRGITVALPTRCDAGSEVAWGKYVGREPQPLQILEECALELGSASLTVVIFDAEEDLSAERPCQPPHEDRVDDMADVQEPGRSRRKSRQWRTHPRPKVRCQPPPINGPHGSYKLQVPSYKLRRLSAPQRAQGD